MRRLKHIAVLMICGSIAFALINFRYVDTIFALQEVEPKKVQVTQRSGDDTVLYMQAKLSNAERVLNGLVTRNFDDIKIGAAQMKRISEAAHWPTTVDEVYQHFSFEFRRQCDKLVQQANVEDLRAAHFTYLQMTTICIDCHDYVRPRFKVRKERGGPVRLIPTEWGPARKLPKPAPEDDTT